MLKNQFWNSVSSNEMRLKYNNNNYCKSVLNFSEGISYVQKCTLMRLTLPHTNASHSVKHLVIWTLQIILCQCEVLAWLSCCRLSSNMNYPRSKLCAFLDLRERNESWLEIHAANKCNLIFPTVMIPTELQNPTSNACICM